MEEYKELFRLEIGHDYFMQSAYSGVGIRVIPASAVLMKTRQLLLKSRGENSWSLIGNVNSAGVYEGEDRIEFEFFVRDISFLYYTKWENYERTANYHICLSDYTGEVDLVRELKILREKKKRPGVLFSGSLVLGNEMYRKRGEYGPQQVKLYFAAREMGWEYVFVPREKRRMVKGLELEEQNGRLQFTEPVPGSCSWVDGPVWKCALRKPLRLSYYYEYQLDLFEIQHTDPLMKRKIVKNIGCPEPGEYYDKEQNCIRKVVYF